MAKVFGRGEVWSGGVKLASFRCDSGSVTVDRSNACRRTCSFALSTGELVSGSGNVIPASATDLFAPFGNEVILYYSKDGVETQLGVFGIVNVKVDDSGDDLLMTIDGQDRARAYGQAGFTDIYTIAAATNVVTAIYNLLSTRVVGFTQSFNIADTTSVTPSAPIVYGPGDDPWAKATELADSIGCELFMDEFGVTTLTAVPDPAAAGTAASYDEGVNNTAVKISRNLSRSKTPNYIIRDGQGSGISAPVRGVAEDTNPTSPTFVNGPYGQVVDYQSSSLYTTAAQALAAAQAALYLAQGSIETVSVDIIPDPARDVDDVIEITRARAGIASGTKYVVDAITLDFSYATLMTMTTRAIAGIS